MHVIYLLLNAFSVMSTKETESLLKEEQGSVLPQESECSYYTHKQQRCRSLHAYKSPAAC